MYFYSISEGDNSRVYPSLSMFYAQIGLLYEELAPHIEHNAALTETILFAGNGCEQLAKELKTNRATVEDVAEFIKITSKKMILASK